MDAAADRDGPKGGPDSTAPQGSPTATPPRPAVSSTGPQEAGPAGTPSDPRVEDALSRLTELDGMPLAEQVAVYADIHRRLDGVLVDPESRG